MSTYLEEIIVSIGAIGTFLLALLGYWNIFKPLKPRLNICHGTTGGYLTSEIIPQQSESSLSLTPVLSLLYRLKVKNQNKFYSVTAKNVYIRFIEIYKMGYNDEWIKLEPFNPFKMRWISGTNEHESFSNDLGRGEYLFINFFTILIIQGQDDNSNVTIMEIIPGQRGIENISLPSGFPRTELYGEGKFKFKLLVFGDNIKSKQYEYEVECKLHPNWRSPTVNIKRL